MIQRLTECVRRMPAVLALLLVSALSLVAPLTLPSAVIYAQEGEENDPRCAVVNYGEVTECPPGSGITEGCGVLNSGSDDPELSKWRSVPCESAEFVQAAIPPGQLICSNAEQAGESTASACDPALSCQEDCNLVQRYIDPAVKVASALVGIGVTTAIVWNGIKYSRSADDPQAVSDAKQKISVALLVLVGYLLFYQFLNWVIPGGVNQAGGP